MSETVLKILLSELAIVRIFCLSSTCGGVLEMPIERLENLDPKAECPMCKAFLRFDSNYLKLIGQAIREAKEAKREIEFVIRQGGKDREAQ